MVTVEILYAWRNECTIKTKRVCKRKEGVIIVDDNRRIYRELRTVIVHVLKFERKWHREREINK